MSVILSVDGADGSALAQAAGLQSHAIRLPVSHNLPTALYPWQNNQPSRSAGARTVDRAIMPALLKRARSQVM